LAAGLVVQGDSRGATHLFEWWELSDLLLLRFPDAYGGIHGTGAEGTWVVLTTPGHQREIQAVIEEFNRAHPTGGRPTYRIDEAAHTLARLNARPSFCLLGFQKVSNSRRSA
jgi:hypothetical protein